MATRTAKGVAKARRAAVDGRRRAIIEDVRPEIDCGRFPIKRVTGEPVHVEADVFTDGHDLVRARLLWRPESARNWRTVEMEPLGNDRWTGSFLVDRLGRYVYTLEAWVDAFRSWARDLKKRVDAGQDVDIDLRIGAALIRDAAARASGSEARRLRSAADSIAAGDDAEARVRLALDGRLIELVERFPDRDHLTTYPKQLEVVVDPPRARFSAWYEMFPRSAARDGRHGTLRDVIDRLDYVAAMGFDTLYLPPIHPIGATKRKGSNNVEEASPDDVGSPWAIGGAEGGHKAIHPALGSFDDLRALVDHAAARAIDLAIDIAFQASPDHPYVEKHRDWFRERPDGTVQYAENPPKKYQDIYPFDFECDDWRALWEELESVFLFWIEHGVRTFRVDNPHTKPFPFWEWVIGRIKARHPETVFLSEAFTRPRIMYRLAKLGFTQSYTYFAWRNEKWELTQYMEELTQTEVVDYFRPSFWPNTPDILTEFLQTGGRPAFMLRLVLAATLTANYGIYGPAYELLEHIPREPGSEEYWNSEKYQIRDWDLDRPDSLRDFIARVNRIRRDNLALHANRSLRFQRIDNEQVVAYTKQDPGDEGGIGNLILTAVNLDPVHTQSGWIELPLEELGIVPDRPYLLEDLLSGSRYTWSGAWNYIEMNPHVVPAHIFRISQST